MSHYYARIKGTRGEATRCGSKSSGIWGHICGWNVGARVEIYIERFTNIYGEQEERDVVRVFKTGGTNRGDGEIIAEFYE